VGVAPPSREPFRSTSTGLTRRTFLKAAGLATGLGATGALRWPARAARPSHSGARIVGVDVSQHPVPFPANLQQVADFDQRWLDAQAQRYWDEYAQFLGRPLGPGDQADFWFRFIALPLQQKAMLGQSLDPRRHPIEKDLALMHMVGYYGGIWFFKKIDEFSNGSDSSTAECPGTGEGPADSEFDVMVRILSNSIRAAREGTDADVLAFAENAIWDVPLIAQVTDTSDLPTRRGLIGGYSYNVGYTNAILVPDNRALPPPVNPNGPTPFDPPWNSFLFTPDGVFDATYPVWADPATANSLQPLPPNPAGGFEPVPYLIGDGPALALARPLFTAARADHADEFERIRAGLVDRTGAPVARGDLNVLSQAGFNTGTATWTAIPFLDLRRWDEPSFHLIVALSIFFVQAVQAAGQACMAAAAAGDAQRARDAVMTAALVYPFGLSYLIGSDQVSNVHYACRNADQSVPPFVFSRA
jgi:hypothetical protein